MGSAARRRGVTTGRRHPWGDEWDQRRCHTAVGSLNRTSAVGMFPQGATPDGLYELVGHIYQWTSTLLRPYPYDAADGREDPADEGLRVCRGGSWGAGSAHNRCATRSHPFVLFQNERTGLRLACDLAGIDSNTTDHD